MWGEMLGSVEGDVGKCVGVWVKVRGDVGGSAVLGFPVLRPSPPSHSPTHFPTPIFTLPTSSPYTPTHFSHTSNSVTKVPRNE